MELHFPPWPQSKRSKMLILHLLAILRKCPPPLVLSFWNLPLSLCTFIAQMPGYLAAVEILHEMEHSITPTYHPRSKHWHCQFGGSLNLS